MGFRRDRRDEKTKDKLESSSKANEKDPSPPSRPGMRGGDAARSSNFDDSNQLAQEFSQKILRLHTEYQKYFSGAEKKAPQALRLQLEQDARRLTQTLKETMARGASALKLKSALTSYETYLALWDKQLSKREKTP